MLPCLEANVELSDIVYHKQNAAVTSGGQFSVYALGVRILAGMESTLVPVLHQSVTIVCWVNAGEIQCGAGVIL